MNSIADVIEKKFAEAERLFLDGSEPIHVETSALFGLRYEMIGLDCQKGGSGCFRYLVSRCSVDTKAVRFSKGTLGNFGGLDVTNIFVRYPRMAGDYRTFEELTDADGDILLVNAEEGMAAELGAYESRLLSSVAIQSLAEQIATLRVAKSMPRFWPMPL